MAKEYCHRCNEETMWLKLKRGSNREKCMGCGDVYPCRHSCDHLDCQWEKEEWAKKNILDKDQPPL